MSSDGGRREIEVRVRGMHCASCGIVVDDAVEDLPGVIRSQTDVRAGATRVEHDGSVATESIIDAIIGVGYIADA